MSTAIARRLNANQLTEIKTAASECRQLMQAAQGSDIGQALALAESMQRLRDCLTPEVMQSVSALQGTAVGFKTDKDGKGGYAGEELRDFAIEATIRGFNLVGNECNVISGRFYGAKAGFERLVKTFPGLENFSDAYDIKEMVGQNAKVQAIATFNLDGQPQRFCRQKENTDNGVFDNRITVRVNSGMGADAIEGKAKRKFYAWLYDRLCGNSTETPEGEVGDGDGAKKELVPMFSGGAVKEEVAPVDDGAPLVVAEYRGKFAAITERPEIGKIMGAAGRDARLTAEGRKTVAAMASEAQKLWPKRLDAETAAPSPEPAPAETPATDTSESDLLEDQYTEILHNATTDRGVNATLAEAKANAHLTDAAKGKLEIVAANRKKTLGQKRTGGQKELIQ